MRFGLRHDVGLRHMIATKAGSISRTAAENVYL